MYDEEDCDDYGVCQNCGIDKAIQPHNHKNDSHMQENKLNKSLNNSLLDNSRSKYRNDKLGGLPPSFNKNYNNSYTRKKNYDLNDPLVDLEVRNRKIMKVIEELDDDDSIMKGSRQQGSVGDNYYKNKRGKDPTDRFTRGSGQNSRVGGTKISVRADKDRKNDEPKTNVSFL